MVYSENNINLLEVSALLSVVSPFAGFGLTELFSAPIYLIVGVAIFCTWMFATSILFVDRLQQQSAATETPEGNYMESQ